MILDANKLKADILNDMRVDLSEEFDRNFERKAFFSDKWKPRAHNYPAAPCLWFQVHYAAPLRAVLKLSKTECVFPLLSLTLQSTMRAEKSL